MSDRKASWTWVPTLYFVEGIPYFIVNTVALIMYKRMGLSDAQCTLYASWLSLPWVIKPVWSPIVEMFRTKRWWIIVMQWLMAFALAGVAFTIPTSFFVQCTMLFFFLLAFSSATHDIAADGFYIIALDEREQAFNVGVRSTFYRVSSIVGQGLLLMMIGALEIYTGRPTIAWSVGLGAVAVLLAISGIYHLRFLPRPLSDCRPDHTDRKVADALKEFGATFLTFLQKPHIVPALAFLLLYRLPEALLAKICPLFLTSRLSAGGLNMSTSELGFANGTLGVIGLTLGGILGGIAVSYHGFKKWRWPMIMAISLPNCVYIFLAYFQPENIWWANVGIAIEQFGYGFGFTLYMLFMLYFSQGKSKAAHYAICTGFMALSMLLPGQIAGLLSEKLDYYNAFIVIMALVPVTFIVAALIRVPDNFGRKS